MSSSSSNADVEVGQTAVKGDFEIIQEGALFDWDKPKGLHCCCCFSYVLQVVMTASVCGSFLFGFSLSLLNTSINTIGKDYQWCGNEVQTDCTAFTNYVAFISTAVFIGAAAGSMTAGKFIFLGRRMVMLLSMFIFTFGIISSVVSNSFSALLWARLVVGYAVGVVSFIAPLYIAEMSPAEKRGTYGVLHQLFITIGIFIGVLIGLPFSSNTAPCDLDETDPDNEDYCDGGENDPAYIQWLTDTLPTFDKIWWRVMLGLGIIPTLLAVYLLTRVYLFETPHYYVESRRMEDAQILLKQLRNSDDVVSELQDIKKGFEEAQEAAKHGLSLGKAFRDGEYRWVIIVGCVLSAFQQFSGINVFVVSSNALFEEAGLSGTLVTVMSTVLTFVNVFMTFPALILIEKMGRKSLMLLGTAGQFIGVLPAAIMYWINPDSNVTTWLAAGGAIVFIVFFAVAYGPVLWVFLFEIYPSEIKGAAAGLATAVNWLASIVMVFTTNYITNQVAYTLFAVMNGIAIVIVITMMKETKGRSIDDSPYFTKKGTA